MALLEAKAQNLQIHAVSTPDREARGIPKTISFSVPWNSAGSFPLRLTSQTWKLPGEDRKIQKPHLVICRFSLRHSECGCGNSSSSGISA